MHLLLHTILAVPTQSRAKSSALDISALNFPFFCRCKGRTRLFIQKGNPKLGGPAIQETPNKIHSVTLVLVQVIKSPISKKKKSPAKETRLMPIRMTAPKSDTTVITVCFENLALKGKRYLKSMGPISA